MHTTFFFIGASPSKLSFHSQAILTRSFKIHPSLVASPLPYPLLPFHCVGAFDSLTTPRLHRKFYIFKLVSDLHTLGASKSPQISNTFPIRPIISAGNTPDLLGADNKGYVPSLPSLPSTPDPAEIIDR